MCTGFHIQYSVYQYKTKNAYGPGNLTPLITNTTLGALTLGKEIKNIINLVMQQMIREIIGTGDIQRSQKQDSI